MLRLEMANTMNKLNKNSDDSSWAFQVQDFCCSQAGGEEQVPLLLKAADQKQEEEVLSSDDFIGKLAIKEKEERMASIFTN